MKAEARLKILSSDFQHQVKIMLLKKNIRKFILEKIKTCHLCFFYLLKLTRFYVIVILFISFLLLNCFIFAFLFIFVRALRCIF